MASLKDCRAKAKRLGFKVIAIPPKSRLGQKYRYRVDHFYAKSVEDLSKAISWEARRKKQSEVMRKLNGHRLKYGYKTIPRIKR